MSQLGVMSGKSFLSKKDYEMFLEYVYEAQEK